MELPGELLIIAFGLGLLGFIEPCSIGSSLVILKSIEVSTKSSPVLQLSLFTLSRAAFIGLFGIVAVILGSAILEFQKFGWVFLGGTYLLIGSAYLFGYSKFLNVRIGASLGGLRANRRAACLGLFFGLNIPACAAPLLATLFVNIAVTDQPNLIQGFATMAVFGFALSTPLLAIFLVPRLQHLIMRFTALSDHISIWIGVVLIAVGTWSIYLAIVK